MGRSALVTYEQVAAAAAECVSLGRTPTAKLIRQLLGGVGSYGTIQQHLLEWQSSRGEAPATRILSQELQEAVFKFVDEESWRANRALRQDLDGGKETSRDLATDNERRCKEVDQLRAELAARSQEKAEQDGRIARLLRKRADGWTARSCYRHNSHGASKWMPAAAKALEASRYSATTNRRSG